MFTKHIILAIVSLLILSTGAGAETEREAVVNHAQSATWAYYTDDTSLANVTSSSRWYISPIAVGVRTDAFSLGPISNGKAAWWTIGTGVGTFNSNLSNIAVSQNLDNDSSNTFLDVGQNLLVTNSLIHSDRQRLQGKTHPVEWYFFQAPNGAWYIVNAPGYGSALTVLRFAGRDGQYIWPPVDVSGFRYTATPDPRGSALTITFTAVANSSPARFLSFPLDCGDANCAFKYSQRAYTPKSITAVLDHEMTDGKDGVVSFYSFDGTVVAYTGETGKGKAEDQGCYPKVGGGAFSVNALYQGTNDGCSASQGLNYDGHPGYDYHADLNTPVKAAAGGTVVNVLNLNTKRFGMCVPRGIDAHNCDEWGFIGIDHGNGFVTQYGHLSNTNHLTPGQHINEGDLIGWSGQKAPIGIHVDPHFHFEVLKADPKAKYGYSPVDPYGWEGGAGNDPLEKLTLIKNIPLWK